MRRGHSRRRNGGLDDIMLTLPSRTSYGTMPYDGQSAPDLNGNLVQNGLPMLKVQAEYFKNALNEIDNSVTEFENEDYKTIQED